MSEFEFTGMQSPNEVKIKKSIKLPKKTLMILSINLPLQQLIKKSAENFPADLLNITRN